jgi:septum site-determining protein MinC
MSNAISIKGTREGLTIALGPGTLEDLLRELAQHLSTQGAFFRGGMVTLQAGERGLSEQDLVQLKNVLAEHEMLLRTVSASDVGTQEATKALGLRLLDQTPAVEAREGDQVVASELPPTEPPPAPTPPVGRTPQDLNRGVLIRHLLRSGQIVRHTGHVVVIGDVNAGAEIIAGGDVIIWGRLHGTVHAGAMGNRQAVVCALELVPLQLRIGDLVARPEENEPPRRKREPKRPAAEIASVRDNMIVVEVWDRALRGV